MAKKSKKQKKAKKAVKRVAKAAKRAAPKKAKKRVSPVPAGMATLTTQLVIPRCAEAMSFYSKAFGAKELSRALTPDGRGVWHASMKIGDSVIFMNDPDPSMGPPPQALRIWVYGANIDARFERARAAGVSVVMPPADMFWGDRMAMVSDPYGHMWVLAEHVKDMSAKEMRAAGEAFAKEMQAKGQSAA